MIRVLRALTVCLLAAAVAVAMASWWRRPAGQTFEEWVAHVEREMARATPDLDGGGFGPVGPFAFQGIDGRPVTDRDLDGKVYVVACFFTCCTETCPAITGSMARLQSELSNLPDLRLVSLTVDPEHDSPEKLKAYAETFGADSVRWWFLTGDRDKVEAFVIGQLKQGVQQNKGPDVTPGNRVLHSERLILVDRQGRIRGFYAGTDADAVDRLARDARQLHG